MKKDIITTWSILAIEVVFILLIKFWAFLNFITPSYRNMIINFDLLFVLITGIIILTLHKNNKN